MASAKRPSRRLQQMEAEPCDDAGQPPRRRYGDHREARGRAGQQRRRRGCALLLSVGRGLVASIGDRVRCAEVGPSRVRPITRAAPDACCDPGIRDLQLPPQPLPRGAARLCAQRRFHCNVAAHVPAPLRAPALRFWPSRAGCRLRPVRFQWVEGTRRMERFLQCAGRGSGLASACMGLPRSRGRPGGVRRRCLRSKFQSHRLRRGFRSHRIGGRRNLAVAVCC
mmetsp:Transcript_24575/g.65969  ORF Transcript_24575/g.65969 Transcript_24575/m.65969 type:complete len:224 (-) Transcript_24575:295-966(-)